jgi:putative ABC transport system substrate-binding protein
VIPAAADHGLSARRLTRRRLAGGALAAVGAALVACDRVSLPSARPPPVPVIGLLTLTLDPVRTGFIEALRQGLRDLGYVEGTNLVVDVRNADGNMDRLPTLCAELIARGVALIVAGATPETDAARAVTQTVPIVSMNVGDPVALGFVASLGRPGGNLTGLTNLTRSVLPKGLELLRELMPDLAHMAALYNPNVASKPVEFADLRTAGEALRVAVRPFEVRSGAEVERALAAAVAERAEALYILNDSVTNGQLPRIAEFVQANRLPAVSVMPAFPASGGLMSYGASVAALWRRGATYVDKILKGAKPADLPIERPTAFELVLNLGAARTLGLKVSESVVQQATEVIG